MQHIVFNRNWPKSLLAHLWSLKNKNYVRPEKLVIAQIIYLANPWKHISWWFCNRLDWDLMKDLLKLKQKTKQNRTKNQKNLQPFYHIIEGPMLLLDKWSCLTLNKEHPRTSKATSTFCEQQFYQNSSALCLHGIKSKNLILRGFFLSLQVTISPRWKSNRMLREH